MCSSDLNDIEFRIHGTNFAWKVFHLPEIDGVVHWAGDSLTLSNISGKFYSGAIEGGAHLSFAGPSGTEFEFLAAVTNVQLRSLLGDISTSTNRADGILNGELRVTRANTEDPLSWQGGGKLLLTEGLLWDYPVFAFFSPMLNAVAPGLGNSRARSATATFSMTNSVLRTRDLEINATGMRMNFEGTVDFDTRINAKAEAELLRNVPGIGFIFSKLLWPVTKVFEYHVTGTLGEPKHQPMHLPARILLMPLQPIRTIKELFQPGKPEKSNSPHSSGTAP